VYRKGGSEHTLRSDLYISTIPLTLMIPMLGERVPAEVHAAVRGLKHKGIVFVYLKLDKPQLTPDHWVYIPEEHIAVHRISEFTNFSRDCAPEGKTMVCAEITSTKGDKYWMMKDEELIKLAARDGILIESWRVASPLRAVPRVICVHACASAPPGAPVTTVQQTSPQPARAPHLGATGKLRGSHRYVKPPTSGTKARVRSVKPMTSFSTPRRCQ